LLQPLDSILKTNLNHFIFKGKSFKNKCFKFHIDVISYIVCWCNVKRMPTAFPYCLCIIDNYMIRFIKNITYLRFRKAEVRFKLSSKVSRPNVALHNLTKNYLAVTHLCQLNQMKQLSLQTSEWWRNLTFIL
jgi:hypothetical protein